MPGVEALYHPFNLCGSYPRISIQTRKLSIIHKSSVTCSKKMDYQDFQGYATPLRLFPVTEPSICTHSSVEEISGSLRGNSQSVYAVSLCTSTMFGSGLSDLSAGILLCLIDEKGDSVLQRIPATPVGTSMKADLPVLCFQRSSVDQFVFRGPKLGRIQSLWLGLESVHHFQLRMSITNFTEELASTFPAEVLFKANVHHGDEIFPKILPGVCKSSFIVEGDGGVGSVRQINFTDAMPYKYWKERIDILDEANLEWKLTVFEGGNIGTKLEWATCHVKLVSAPGGGSVYKISGEHKSLSGMVYSETDIESDKNALVGMFKALDAYLLANPGIV